MEIIEDPVTTSDLKKAVGKKVEVVAFGLRYSGRLKNLDLKASTIFIVDGKDSALLDIERIEAFRRVK